MGSTSSPLSGTTTSGSNDYVSRSAGLGQGMASEVVVHKGVGTGDGNAGVFIQDSLGRVVRATADTDTALASRFMTWWNKVY